LENLSFKVWCLNQKVPCIRGDIFIFYEIDTIIADFAMNAIDNKY